MSLPPPGEHFQGRSVPQHLKEAREKGAAAASEIHGTEMPGSLSALCDGAKEMALSLALLWIIFQASSFYDKFWTIALLFSCGWILWKTGRSALLGWSRMERLHRLIEEERWEIEHHRSQEKEELKEMYLAKGLEGELLDGVVDTLMSDDNRLLRVMLEEELGLTLEAIDHPLKQAAGAFFGTSAAALLCLFGFWAAPSFGIPLAAGIALLLATLFSIKLERNSVIYLFTWNLAVAGATAGCVYFLLSLIGAL